MSTYQDDPGKPYIVGPSGEFIPRDSGNADYVAFVKALAAGDAEAVMPAQPPQPKKDAPLDSIMGGGLGANALLRALIAATAEAAGISEKDFVVLIRKHITK